MADRLADLPPAPASPPSPAESNVMQRFFGSGSDAPAPDTPTKPTAERGWMETLKLVTYASLIFFALANPWVDAVFCMLPYCGDNVLTLLLIKTLMFAMIFLITYKTLF